MATATHAEAKTDPLELRNEQFDRHRFPLTQSIGKALFLDQDALSDTSVDLIIRGFAQRLPSRSKAWSDFKDYSDLGA